MPTSSACLAAALRRSSSSGRPLMRGGSSLTTTTHRAALVCSRPASAAAAAPAEPSQRLPSRWHRHVAAPPPAARAGQARRRPTARMCTARSRSACAPPASATSTAKGSPSSQAWAQGGRLMRCARRPRRGSRRSTVGAAPAYLLGSQSALRLCECSGALVLSSEFLPPIHVRCTSCAPC